MNDKKKKIINNKTFVGLVKVFAFFLVFLIILEALSFTVFSKKSGASYKNKFSNAYSFTSEPDNTIQVAGIGNSDLYSAFSPTVLWDDYGYTSTIIAAPRLTVANAYELLKQLFKTQSPQVLFIEVDMLYKDVPNKSKKAFEEYKKSTAQLQFNKFINNFDSNRFQTTIENHFTIFLFHDRWKGKNVKKTGDNSHGYYFSKDIVSLKSANHMKNTDDKEGIVQENLDLLDDMVTMCKEKGVEVVFLEMPSVTSWSMERHNAVQELADSYNFDFIDCNLLMDNIEINIKNDFRDKGNHLNYYGAKKITKYVGNYLSKYSLENRAQNPNYSFWNESSTEFKSEHKVK